MVNIIILVCVIVLVTIIAIKRFSSRGYGSSYSWFEILNPFDSSPKQIYKHLSPENKGAFWSVTSSIAIGVISCWLGFSVQYFVYNSSQTESDKLAHYEVVEKFRPKYQAVFDSITTDVIEKMSAPLGYSENKNVKITPDDYEYFFKYKKFPKGKTNTPEAQLASFTLDEENWNAILYTGKKIVQVSSEIAPYLDFQKNMELLNNNTKILAGIQLFELANDSMKLDSAIVVKKCISQLVKASVLQEASYQTNWAEICAMEYSLYKMIRAQESSNRSEALAYGINSAIIMPMISNLMVINSSFTPVESLNHIVYGSIVILLISVFIGYLLMRIVVMKFFDIQSMRPNPQMSQSEYEKIVRKLNNTEKENNQHKVNDVTLLNSIDSFKKEIKEKESLIDILGKEYEKENSLLREQIRDLSSKLNLAQEENEQLHKRNDELEEAKNKSEEKENNI